MNVTVHVAKAQAIVLGITGSFDITAPGLNDGTWQAKKK